MPGIRALFTIKARTRSTLPSGIAAMIRAARWETLGAAKLVPVANRTSRPSVAYVEFATATSVIWGAVTRRPE